MQILSLSFNFGHYLDIGLSLNLCHYLGFNVCLYINLGHTLEMDGITVSKILTTFVTF